MAEATEHPESLSEINSLDISNEIRDFVSDLSSEIQDGSTDRAEWETRQDEYDRKRYGIRAKRTFPWVGAANFMLPQIDSDINRLKPAYLNLAYGVSPIVNFEPFGPEDIEPAKKREAFFDWVVKTRTNFFHEYNLGIDQCLSRGYTIFKIFWKFSTRKFTKYLDLSELDQEIVDAIFMPEVTDRVLFDIIAEEMKVELKFQENVDEIVKAIKKFREGKTKFEMTFVEAYENNPEIKACDPRDEVSFPVGTTDLQDAFWIDYKFWVSKNSLKSDMKSQKYETYSDNDIETWGSKTQFNTYSDTLKNIRDGVSNYRKNDDLILMHEVCTWYDVDGDGIDERVIITYPDSDPKSVLRFIELPYDHGMFPYVAVRREINDAEIMASRGIPSLDDDFQTGISTLFNQDIDAGTISNTPTVVARKNSVKNLRNLRYIPGQVVETENGAADYQVVQNQNLGQAHRFNNMQYLKAWANDRVGNLTAALSQINNTPGKGTQGQKSATEVESISASAGQLQAMDLLIFQMQMADVYYQMDALQEQFGDDQYVVMVTGEKPMRISRAEIQGKFNIVPNGRLDNSNPVLRANKSLALYDRFIQNPYIKQYELTKMTLGDFDQKASRLILKTEEEVQQEQANQMQMQAQMKQADLQEQLGIRKISDAMELDKERKLSIIQGRKYASE